MCCFNTETLHIISLTSQFYDGPSAGRPARFYDRATMTWGCAPPQFK